MKRKILLLLAVAVTCVLVLASCLVTPNGNGDDTSRDNFTIVRPDGGNTMMSVREAYYNKYGLMINVVTADSDPMEKEIVLGATARPISTHAKGLINSAISKSSHKDGAGFVVCKQGESIAVYWSDSYIEQMSIDYFITEYIEKDNLALEDGYVYTSVFSLAEYKESVEQALEDEYYEKLAAGLGADVAEALGNLYGIYDDRLYEWMAGLYDPGVGGYYFSNSALANEGFLPDLESTVQALRFIANTGMLNNFGGDVNALDELLPDEIRQSFIRFAHSCQSPEDGYYYHPQWGPGASALRSGRDLGWGVALLAIFGEIPLYDTPSDVKGSLGAPGGTQTSILTDRLGGSATVAASKVIATATVADRFSSEEKFIEYFNSFKWANPIVGTTEGSSYHPSGTLEGQKSQIKAAGLGPLLIELLDEMQETVQQNLRDKGLPENGLWDPHNSYDAINGTMKIGSIYSFFGAKMNYTTEIMECVIDIILLEEADFDGETPGATITVYNPWISAKYLLSNMNEHGSAAEATAFRALIRDNAADMINATTRKAAIFKRDDGSFSIYSTGKAPASQYGAPIAVKDTIEGDVNGACIISSGIVSQICSVLNVYEYIGLETLPMFYESDLDRYLDIMLSASPVVKDDIALEDEPITFEDYSDGTESGDIAGLVFTESSGSFTVAEDTSGKSDYALKLSTVPGTAGDNFTLHFANPRDTALCHAMEWRMCIDSASTDWATFFQIRLDKCYMLSFVYENGAIELYSSADTNKNLENKLGIGVGFGEWHTYRVEYYQTEDSVITKVYVDGDLRAINDNYIGKSSGNTPASNCEKAVFSSPSRTELVAYFDDVGVEKLNRAYVDEAVVDPNKVKTFEDLEEGKLPTGVSTSGTGFATVTDDPDGSDKALMLSGKGNTYFSASASGSTSNCFVFDSDVYVESGSGVVGRILIAKDSDSVIAGYALSVDGDTVTLLELSKDAANGDVFGEALGEFSTGEWVHIRIEYYRYQRKAIVTVDGAEAVSEVYYRLANIGASFAQANVTSTQGAVFYLDDLTAERINKPYVEGGTEIEDDTSFPELEGQDYTSVSGGAGYDGTVSFEGYEQGDTEISGVTISPNGEPGNSVTVDQDPTGDDMALKLSTVYSENSGNTVKFEAAAGTGSVYVFETDFYYEFVGNRNTNVNEIYLKSGSISETGDTVFSFTVRVEADGTLSLVEKGAATPQKTLITGISVGEWHKLRIEYNSATATATVYLDDGAGVTSTNYHKADNTTLPFNYVAILANKSTNEILYLDNVKVTVE